MQKETFDVFGRLLTLADAAARVPGGGEEQIAALLRRAPLRLAFHESILEAEQSIDKTAVTGDNCYNRFQGRSS